MAGQYTIGIVGGGQLARMMHQSAVPLGVRVRLLSETPDSSAAQVIADVTVGDCSDRATLEEFANGCDAITFDHEHVPTELLRDLALAGRAVRPGPESLIFAQDKAAMRERLSDAGFPCPNFRICAEPDDLVAAGEALGWPVVAKTSRGGYDGKGVFIVAAPTKCHEPFEVLHSSEGSGSVRIVAEELVDFTAELSAIVVRSPSGQTVSYPISQSIQSGGVCVETITPPPDLEEEVATRAQVMALQIAKELDVVGVLAVELMLAKDGRLLVNELAMRPHNTGHWTIDGAITSQFENHIRAVLDLPLGSPQMRSEVVVMANILGGSEPDLTGALQHCFARDRELRVHLYGKPVSQGRKVGHVTALDTSLPDALRRARHGARYLMGDPNA